MSKIFVTNRENQGREIVANKYVFFDGEMKVSDHEAELLAPILTRFYGCTLEDGPDEALPEGVSEEPTLLSTQTMSEKAQSQTQGEAAATADAPAEDKADSEEEQPE